MNVHEINRITGVRVADEHTVELQFSDGYVGRLDLAPAIWGPALAQLKDPVYFCQVRLEDDTIRWPNGADFCPDVLRYWCEVGSVQSQEETDAYFARGVKEKAVS